MTQPGFNGKYPVVFFRGSRWAIGKKQIWPCDACTLFWAFLICGVRMKLDNMIYIYMYIFLYLYNYITEKDNIHISYIWLHIIFTHKYIHIPSNTYPVEYSSRLNLGCFTTHETWETSHGFTTLVPFTGRILGESERRRLDSTWEPLEVLVEKNHGTTFRIVHPGSLV